MMHVYRVVYYTQVRRGHWKDNELALHWTEMKMIRWMCGVKLGISYLVLN